VFLSLPDLNGGSWLVASWLMGTKSNDFFFLVGKRFFCIAKAGEGQTMLSIRGIRHRDFNRHFHASARYKNSQ